jgi:predicted O-linked N-acetylglucosamine transferase (SPINDLY family)
VERAVESLRRAAALAPDAPRVHLNLGNALEAAGETLAATEAYERSVALSPSWRALHNLGACLTRLGRGEDALEAFRKAIALEPGAFGTHLAMAELFSVGGMTEEANQAFARAIETAPADPDVVATLARVLLADDRDEQAIAVARRALETSPANEGLLLVLVHALVRNDALASAERIFESGQTCAEGPGPWMHLARLRARQRRFEEETKLLDEALARYPKDRAVRTQKAHAVQREGRLDEAEELLHSLVEEDPTQDVLGILALLHLEIGDAGRAMELVRQAEAQIASRGLPVVGPALLTSNYVDDMTPEEVAEGHRRWARVSARRSQHLTLQVQDRDPERRLRVGYVSPDFRSHSVGLFMEPVLAAHDRSAVEVVCYSTTERPPDEVTERIRALPLEFVDVGRLAAGHIAKRIVEDRIDLLVDLCGWTTESKLDIFRRKPAPVQISYLGYPHTTGIEEMDYRVTDDLADPAPDADAAYVEKLFRLGRSAWAFSPVMELPDVTPRDPSRPLTFGSFNNLSKVSPSTFDMFAGVLLAVPGSRLILKTKQLEQPRAQQRVHDAFAARGVGPERLDLRTMARERSHHLQMYGEVDIGLDTFPYNGTTTTCEALLMGVPVVSRFGGTPASRVGRSLVSAVGLPELVVSSLDDYVRVAAALARDAPRLAALRAGLRERLRASELGDVAGLARALERAYRAMWRAWLAQAAGER